MEQLYKSGKKISIRPHPRYSNIDFVKKIFAFANVEDIEKISIEQSLLQPIIIDNVSNPENFNKLKKLGYICLYKEHRLLSEVVEEKA